MSADRSADLEGAAVSQSATDYLLLSNLNLSSRLEPGKAGNAKLRALWWEVLDRLRPTVFCDIGAFDGRESITAKQRFPGLSVYAFEANPEVFNMHASSSGLTGIHYLNVAICDIAGTTTVYAPRTLSRYYSKGQVHPGRVNEPDTTAKTSVLLRNEDATYVEFNVRASTLDEFMAQEAVYATQPSFALWIDVEGAADRVLRGAEAILAHTVAILIETEAFEFWKNQADSTSVTYELIRHGFIPIARDREYGDHQFNILFVKADLTKDLAPELFHGDSILRSVLISSEETVGVASRRRISTGTYSSVGAHFQASIPIIIPFFNSVTYLRNMLAALRRLGLHNIVIVDHASTFPPAVDFLSRIEWEVTVIRLDHNDGPREIFLNPKNFVALPQYFCVTDPDLELNPRLPADFLCELMLLTEHYRIGKAGFALGLEDRDLMRDDVYQLRSGKYHIWEWEARYWRKPIGITSTDDQVYEAGVDTTFALYNKSYFNPADPLKAVRVAGRYTCRHLPWYKETGLPNEESDFYWENQRFSRFPVRGEPAWYPAPTGCSSSQKPDHGNVGTDSA